MFEVNQFSTKPSSIYHGLREIYVFDELHGGNTDPRTVKSFGVEWNKFSDFTDADIDRTATEYFDILPPEMLRKDMYALDVGCGTGRWTKFLSKHLGFVEAIDPSEAILAADKLLDGVKNVRLSMASVDNIPFEDDSFDLVVSIGVLHHIPDTAAAMRRCVKKVKPGGYFYVYLYYNLDNRGHLFRFVFWISNGIRQVVSSLPSRAKLLVCDAIAAIVYMPLIGLSAILRAVGLNWLTGSIPLSSYVNKSWFVIRANALDRFGTPLEQRFSKEQMIAMMEECGLTDIVPSPNVPYYHLVGRKRNE